jgi:stage III sporulation protein AG
LNFKGIFTKDFFKNKKMIVLCAVLIFGISFLVLTPDFDKKETTESETMQLSQYKENLEAELADICSSVEGVGKCRVIVTFSRGAENTYKGSALIESKPPKVMGVSIICRGADSSEVRSKLIEMMTSLFDVGSNRVSVLKLNS